MSKQFHTLREYVDALSSLAFVRPKLRDMDGEFALTSMSKEAYGEYRQIVRENSGLLVASAELGTVQETPYISTILSYCCPNNTFALGDIAHNMITRATSYGFVLSYIAKDPDNRERSAYMGGQVTVGETNYVGSEWVKNHDLASVSRDQLRPYISDPGLDEFLMRTIAYLATHPETPPKVWENVKECLKAKPLAPADEYAQKDAHLLEHFVSMALYSPIESMRPYFIDVAAIAYNRCMGVYHNGERRDIFPKTINDIALIDDPRLQTFEGQVRVVSLAVDGTKKRKAEVLGGSERDGGENREELHRKTGPSCRVDDPTLGKALGDRTNIPENGLSSSSEGRG